LRKIAKEKKAKIYFLKKSDYQINYLSKGGSSFNFGKYKNLFLSLLGEHQIENACLAIKAIEILDKKKIKIGENQIKDALKNVKWQGRLQILREKPYVVLDGAHNLASGKVLKKSLKLFNYRKLFLILGMFSDKNISDFLKEFSDISSKIILSKIESPRSATPEEIEEYFKDKNKIIKVNNLKEAIKVARKISSEKDLILITGSLYLVGEALKLYKSFEIF
jgi:dihydrofolate synthase/folylpolyglutamate synthase